MYICTTEPTLQCKYHCTYTTVCVPMNPYSITTVCVSLYLVLLRARVCVCDPCVTSDIEEGLQVDRPSSLQAADEEDPLRLQRTVQQV